MTRQARAELTRRRILEAAAMLFDERGYQAASTAEVLARSGVSRGSMYFHFASKEDLAKAVIAEQGAWMSLDVAPPAALQAVIDVSHAFARALQENVIARAAVRLAVEYGTFDEPDPGPYEAWISEVRTLLETSREQGDLHPHVNLETTAELLVGAFTGIQLLTQVLNGRRTLDARMTDFWRAMLPGLVPPERISFFEPSGTPAHDGSETSQTL